MGKKAKNKSNLSRDSSGPSAADRSQDADTSVSKPSKKRGGVEDSSKEKPEVGAMKKKDFKNKGRERAINIDEQVAGDKRFATVSSMPIYRSVPRHEKKVTIDKRFQSMFSDEKFQANTKMDKRGRPMNLLNSNDNLVKYYNLDEEDVKEEESDKDEDEIKEEKEDDQIEKVKKDGDSSEEDSSDDDEDELLEFPDLNSRPGIPDTLRKKLRNINVDYARGEAPLLSEEESADDSDSSSVAGEADDDVVHEWGELDRDAATTEESTRRLALCNMDWDRLKAIDLMVLFTSFVPAGGRLLKVSIYPSEFGKKRMVEEELKGPLELAGSGVIKTESVPNTAEDDLLPLKANDDEDDDDDNLVEDDDGDEFQREKLRQYQLNRLKYFYAVMEFDSVESAEKVYEECDGREYESSAAKIDLRYVPDDMGFDEEEPRDVCEGAVNLAKYHPKFFTTTALQQVKVNCTWDETDPSRKDLIDRVFNKKEQIDDDDLKNYLASSSEEESDDDEGAEQSDQPKLPSGKDSDAISKYKALLESIGDAEKSKKNADQGLEITWGLGVKEKTQKLVESKIEKAQDKDMTLWEKSLLKKKQEKLAKKHQQEDESSSDEGSDEDEGGLSMDFDMAPEGEEYESSEDEDSSKGRKRNKDQEDKRSKTVETDPELELLLMDEDTNKKHFNMKKIVESSNESKSKKKRKLKKQKAQGKTEKANDDFKVDVEDSRFSALFTSAQYNIDPSEPNFKKTSAMEDIIKEKQKRRQDRSVEMNVTTTDETNKKTRDQELSYLIKSVKRKTMNSGKDFSQKNQKIKKPRW